MSNVYVEVLEDMDARFIGDSAKTEKTFSDKIMDGDIPVGEVWEDEDSE